VGAAPESGNQEYRVPATRLLLPLPDARSESPDEHGSQRRHSGIGRARTQRRGNCAANLS
jgi:hypothetical protein